MADAVTVQVDDAGYVILLHLTNLSDGTGETDVAKLVKASYTMPGTSTAPSKFAIIGARWNIQGFTSVRLEFDQTTDVVALPMNGNGAEDFTGRRFLANYGGRQSGVGLQDTGSGGNGNLIITTVGATATSTYAIDLAVLKVA